MSHYEFSRAPRNVPFVQTGYRIILSEIPAPGTEAILARLEKVESRSMHGQLPIVWDNAFDYSVWDIAGNKFIDFTSSIFVANVGHSNRKVSQAVRDCLDNAPIHSYSYATRIRANYLERLTQWSGFDKAFLMSSGTESTEAALKLMRMHGQKVGKRRLGIVCFEGAFHGRTMGAQMMSGYHNNHPDMHRIPFPYPWSDQQDFKVALHPENICGFMLETYQGWCACFYPPEYVQAIERFCRANNILLCFDEMQSGFARTGRKFGYEHYGVKPDLICIGKGMGGGLPLSGVLGCADIMDFPEVGEMSSTHSANPLVCAAGLAVIDEIEHLDLVRESERKGLIICSELDKRVSPSSRVSWILGQGLIAAVLFQGDKPELFASKVAERCIEKGVIVVHTGRNSIKIGPPLTIPDEALIEGVQVLSESISEIDKEI